MFKKTMTNQTAVLHADGTIGRAKEITCYPALLHKTALEQYWKGVFVSDAKDEEGESCPY